MTNHRILREERLTRKRLTQDRRIDPAPGIGVGCLVERDGSLLLIRRGKEPSYGLWSIPGGRLKYGEVLHEAAEREVREETGISVEVEEVVAVYDLIERDDLGYVAYHYVLIDFKASYISGDVKASSDALEARWIPIHEVMRLEMPEQLRGMLNEIYFNLNESDDSVI